MRSSTYFVLHNNHQSTNTSRYTISVLICSNSIGCIADLNSLIAEMKTLRQEMVEHERSRDQENEILREQLAESAATSTTNHVVHAQSESGV